MGKKNKKNSSESKTPGRRSKWPPVQLDFLMSHVATYLDTEPAQKSAFWRTFFPLWFSQFPAAEGLPPSALWTSTSDTPSHSHSHDDDDDNTNDPREDDDTTSIAPRNGKKKTMAEMSPTEAVIQVSLAAASSSSDIS